MPYKSTLEDTIKLEDLKAELPPFVKQYFDSRQMRLSLKTMISYAYDFLLFFRFLSEVNPAFEKKSTVHFTIADLGLLSVEDMEEFMSWQRKTCESNTTINRRLSSVSSLYDYLIKRDYLVMKNPVSLIDREKRVKKPIIHLEKDETLALKYAIKTGYGFNDNQVEKNKHSERDYAIFTIFLNEGLRVSELVNINVSDVNLDKHIVRILRKGGNSQDIYLSDQSSEALYEYLKVRSKYLTKETESEKALFVSQKHSRMSVRNVELMCKKYMNMSNPEKAEIISPHKLRATFATDFYEEEPNMLLLKEKMGHSNIQTTTLYADLDKKQLENTRNVIERARNKE